MPVPTLSTLRIWRRFRPDPACLEPCRHLSTEILTMLTMLRVLAARWKTDAGQPEHAATFPAGANNPQHTCEFDDGSDVGHHSYDPLSS